MLRIYIVNRISSLIEQKRVLWISLVHRPLSTHALHFAGSGIMLLPLPQSQAVSSYFVKGSKVVFLSGRSDMKSSPKR